MPCWTQKQMTVEFKIENEKLLIEALFADGFNVSSLSDGLYVNKGRRRAEIRGGRVTVSKDDQSIVNEMKRAYSRAVVKQAASRFGWQLTTTKADTMLAKRRF